MHEQGTISVGRDETADWTIADPDHEISRRHLELSRAGDGLCLRALGVNGVMLQPGGRAMRTGEVAIVGEGDEFSFGPYTVAVRCRPSDRPDASVHAASRCRAATSGDVADAAVLLDAFCEGAGLDASAFAADEPAEILMRAGTIYREVVYQLCDLSTERHRLKEASSLDRTTISANENNPLRWGAPHRASVDLLRSARAGFLDGAAAVQLSLNDLRQHLLASNAAYEAAIASIVERIDPHGLSLSADSKAWFGTSAKQKWAAFERVFGQLKSDLAGENDTLRRVFAERYEQSLREQSRRAE